MAKIQRYPLIDGLFTPNGISVQSVKLYSETNKCNKQIVINLSQTKWFFVLIITVTCFAVFNLALTLWIIKVLQLGKVFIKIKYDIIFNHIYLNSRVLDSEI